jgi:hypothetical protein
MEKTWKGRESRFVDPTEMRVMVLTTSHPSTTPLAASGGHARPSAVLEIGAGVVVPSIRMAAEDLAARGCGLVRVNPSVDECKQMALGRDIGPLYFPLAHRSTAALRGLCSALGLDSHLH